MVWKGYRGELSSFKSMNGNGPSMLYKKIVINLMKKCDQWHVVILSEEYYLQNWN